MKNKEKYLNKIKKLLNLARNSTNASEAANAMSQAQNLMRAHKLTAQDIDLMEIGEASSKGAPSNAHAVPKYMVFLAEVICLAFGVRCFHTYKSGYFHTPKRIVTFYGPNERPQIAAYAFDVLARQMVKARKEYTATMRKSIKASTKIARADTFCEHWVQGAYQVIDEFVVSDAEATLITAYRRKLQEDTGMATAKMREAKKCRGSDNAADAGFQAGTNASLHHGVNGAGQPPIAKIGR